MTLLPTVSPPSAREKLHSVGVSKLSETELLTLLLGSGNHHNTVTQVATAVLAVFKDMTPSVAAVLDEHNDARLYHQLNKTPGVGVAQAARIMACLELGSRLFGTQPITTILQPKEALPHLSFLHRKHTEHCVALYLSARHELLKTQTISQGGVANVIVNPREVFAPGLGLPCAGVIVAHNHPSGDPQPSQEDALVTDNLKAAGELLGIPLNDHIIVARNGWFSFAQEGLL